MHPEDEIYGEYPANIEHMPGAIKVDDVAHRQMLEQEARNYLAAFPHIKRRAERLGQDLVAFTSAHGKEILIGVGVASAAITGGVILYRHPVKRRKRSKNKRRD
jgi:hypothetical protein